MNEPAPLSIAIVIWQGLMHICLYKHSGVRVSDHGGGYWSACTPRLPWLREYVSWRPTMSPQTPWQDVPVGARDPLGRRYVELMIMAETTEDAADLLELARAKVSTDD